KRVPARPVRGGLLPAAVRRQRERGDPQRGRARTPGDGAGDLRLPDQRGGRRAVALRRGPDLGPAVAPRRDDAPPRPPLPRGADRRGRRLRRGDRHASRGAPPDRGKLRAMTMGGPVRAGDLLVALPGVAERLAEARLFAAWPEVAGPAAARSQADSLEDGVLQVSVDSVGWLHRLTLDEPALLARCRAAAPAVSVRAIRFRLASLAAPGPVGGSSPDPAAEASGPDRFPEP